MLKNAEKLSAQNDCKFIYNLSEEAKLKDRIYYREKMLHDEASIIASAEKRGFAKGFVIGFNKGFAIGLAKGEEKTRKSAIARMKQLNYTDEQIKSLFPEYEA